MYESIGKFIYNSSSKNLSLIQESYFYSNVLSFFGMLKCSKEKNKLWTLNSGFWSLSLSFLSYRNPLKNKVLIKVRFGFCNLILYIVNWKMRYHNVLRYHYRLFLSLPGFPGSSYHLCLLNASNERLCNKYGNIWKPTTFSTIWLTFRSVGCVKFRWKSTDPLPRISVLRKYRGLCGHWQLSSISLLLLL